MRKHREVRRLPLKGSVAQAGSGKADGAFARNFFNAMVLNGQGGAKEAFLKKHSLRSTLAMQQRESGPTPSVENRSGPSQTWLNFAKRHSSNRFLRKDPLYALQPELILAFGHDEALRKAFAPEDLGFEADLAVTAPQGFFHGHPIGGPALVPAGPRMMPAIGGPVPLASKSADVPSYVVKRAKGRTKTIEQFLKYIQNPPKPERSAPTLQNDLLNPRYLEILHNVRELTLDLQQFPTRGEKQAYENSLDEEDFRDETLRRSQEAYAGWLVTNSDYRKDAAALKLKGERCVADLCRFPEVEINLKEDSSSKAVGDEFQDRFRREYLAFLGRWCLSGLLTWELPLPVMPVNMRGSVPPPPLAEEQGLNLFIPWSMLRGSTFDFRGVAQAMRIQSCPPHLKTWVERGSVEEGGFSFQRMFWLYRIYRLVLLDRYPEICKNRISSIDQAIAGCVGRGVDLIKRLRQKMMRHTAT